MFWISLPLICFILVTNIDMSDTGSTREKPPRIIPKTLVPESNRIKPPSPKKMPTVTPVVVTSDDVGEKIKPSRLIDDDSDGNNRPTDIFESVSLTPTDTDSDSDDYQPPVKTKHKRYHKHKSRTITVEPDDMTEMINKTDDDGIKGQLMNMSNGLINSVKDNIEDLYIDRKRNAKKTAVGTIGSFVIIVVMICMIVLIKKI